MHHPEVKSLFSAKQIRKRIQELAREIDRDHQRNHPGKPLVAIGILKGSFLFYADLGEGAYCSRTVRISGLELL